MGRGDSPVCYGNCYEGRAEQEIYIHGHYVRLCLSISVYTFYDLQFLNHQVHSSLHGLSHNLNKWNHALSWT
jgi:hypothetical protein